MLRIYEDAIAMLEVLTISIASIERRDTDLAKQLRRAGQRGSEHCRRQLRAGRK